MDVLDKWKKLKKEQEEQLEELKDKKSNVDSEVDRAIDGMYQNNMY